MTPKQKKQLKAQAHKLKPVVMVGQHGLTHQVLSAIEVALTDHELIKIKIASDRESGKEIIETICTELGAEHIQTLGHITTLYRENLKKE